LTSVKMAFLMLPIEMAAPGKGCFVSASMTLPENLKVVWAKIVKLNTRNNDVRAEFLNDIFA
jgi:hypothetical protein